MMETLDDDEDLDGEVSFQPDTESDQANQRLLRHEVQTNAKRLLDLERLYAQLQSVQLKLVEYAKRRQRSWRCYRYYTYVLCKEFRP